MHRPPRRGARRPAFDQTLQRKLTDWFPGVIERIDTAIPVWWGVAAGPALVSLGAATAQARPGRGRGGALGHGRGRVHRHRSHPGRPRRQRQPQRRRGAGRARRGAARAAAHRPARRARLVRRRGGSAGRHLWLRPQPPEGARPRAHLAAQLRDRRLAGAGDARGRGRVRDGGLLRPRPARPLREQVAVARGSGCGAGCARRRAPTR